MYVCMYVCVCVYIYIYIHIHTYYIISYLDWKHGSLHWPSPATQEAPLTTYLKVSRVSVRCPAFGQPHPLKAWLQATLRTLRRPSCSPTARAW